MAHVITFEPAIRWETLGFIFQHLRRLAHRKFLVISWPLEVPRERELLDGVEIVDTKGGVKTHHLLPLFGEKLARYPGVTLFVGHEEGRPSLVLRPHPMGESDEEDLHFSLTAIQRAIGTCDEMIMRIGLERLLEDALVASHDLLEGRKPCPRQEPVFPVIRGTQAILELVDDRERKRKIAQADLRIRAKKERHKKIRA